METTTALRQAVCQESERACCKEYHGSAILQTQVAWAVQYFSFSQVRCKEILSHVSCIRTSCSLFEKLSKPRRYMLTGWWWWWVCVCVWGGGPVGHRGGVFYF